MSLRFKIEPRDVPPTVAARTLGLTLEAFTAKLDELYRRGFPPADPTTGNYDLKAIEVWQNARHPHLFTGPSLTVAPTARDRREELRNRLARLGNG